MCSYLGRCTLYFLKSWTLCLDVNHYICLVVLNNFMTILKNSKLEFYSNLCLHDMFLLNEENVFRKYKTSNVCIRMKMRFMSYFQVFWFFHSRCGFYFLREHIHIVQWTLPVAFSSPSHNASF